QARLVPAALDDEIVDHAMEDRAVVKAHADVSDEVGDGDRRTHGVELHDHRAHVGLHHDDRRVAPAWVHDPGVAGAISGVTVSVAGVTVAVAHVGLALRTSFGAAVAGLWRGAGRAHEQ